MLPNRPVFVDTSSWACLVNQDDPLHAVAASVFQAAITQFRVLITTNYVLLELLPLLSVRNRQLRVQIIMIPVQLLGLDAMQIQGRSHDATPCWCH